MARRIRRGTAVAARRFVATNRRSQDDAVTRVRAQPLPPPLPPHALPTRRMAAVPPPRPVVFATGTQPAAIRYEPPRPGVIASGIPSMTDLTALAVAIAHETSFDRAAIRLQDETRKLARATEALCVVFDWPRRAAWTMSGPIVNESVKELVAGVAGSGQRSIINNALLQPIGPAPSRVVLALRKPPGATFTVQEIAIISTIAIGVTSSLYRLLDR